MSKQQQQNNITVEQYAAQIKSTVFTMTGALGSKMEKIADELLQQVVNLQNFSKTQTEQAKKNEDEILRLQDLLSQNKIPFQKEQKGNDNGKAKIIPAATK